MKYKWILLGTTFCFVLFGWLVYRQLTPSFVPPKLPVPNGFDDLLLYSGTFDPAFQNYDELEPEELHQIVMNSRQSFQLTKQALEKEIGVIVDWSRDPTTGAGKHIVNSTRIRIISRAFVAKIRDCLNSEQYLEAIMHGIDTFRLGKKSYQGGLIVDYVVGLAVQNIAVHELREIAQEDASHTEVILHLVIPLLNSGESSDEVIQRELDYINHYARGIRGLLMNWNTQQLMAATIKATQQSASRTIAHQRLFVLHLAMQVFKDKHGTYPAELKDLNPEIVESIPEDPYSDGPFIYRHEGDSYQLYSLGQNNHDDGGQGDPKESGLGLDVLFNLDLKE